VTYLILRNGIQDQILTARFNCNLCLARCSFVYFQNCEFTAVKCTQQQVSCTHYIMVRSCSRHRQKTSEPLLFRTVLKIYNKKKTNFLQKCALPARCWDCLLRQPALRKVKCHNLVQWLDVTQSQKQHCSITLSCPCWWWIQYKTGVGRQKLTVLPHYCSRGNDNCHTDAPQPEMW